MNKKNTSGTKATLYSSNILSWQFVTVSFWQKVFTNLYVFVLFANLHALYLIYRLGLGMDLHSYLFSKTRTFHYETTQAQILKRAFSFLLILILTQSCTLWL